MKDHESISLATRFTRGVGLVDITPPELQSRLSTCPQEKQGQWDPWTLVSVTDQFRDAMEFLTALTFPATRHVGFATQGGSALVNNYRDGSDYPGCGHSLPRLWNCKFVRIVNQPGRVWDNGILRVVTKYEARIFELYGPDGKGIRHVYCADDGGRWVFGTFGEPHPTEAKFPYTAKRKPDRFKEENLYDLAAAYGFAIPTANDFINAGHYVLYRELVGGPVRSCTIEEADDPAYGYYRRGMGFAEHMRTHAKSVILDLEKCVAINPAYRHRVAPVLAEARRTVAGYKR